MKRVKKMENNKESKLLADIKALKTKYFYQIRNAMSSPEEEMKLPAPQYARFVTVRDFVLDLTKIIRDAKDEKDGNGNENDADL